MKDIFAELYNKVLSFFNKTDEQNKENAKDVACNRLKLVLMQDRTNLSPAIMDRMRKELIELLSKYMELDRELLDLNFEHEDDQMALMLSIPVIRAKSEEEIQAILDKEDEELNQEEEDDSEDSEDETEDSSDEEKEDSEDDSSEADEKTEEPDSEEDDSEDESSDDDSDSDDDDEEDEEEDEDDGESVENEEKKEEFFSSKKSKSKSKSSKEND